MSKDKDDAARDFYQLEKYLGKLVRIPKQSTDRPAIDDLDDIGPHELVTCQICFAVVRFRNADRHGNWHLEMNHL